MHWVVVWLALCGGCLIVPKTVTSERVVSSGVTDAPGPRGVLALEVSRVGRTVTVTLQAPRACVAENYDMVETTTSTAADLTVLDDGHGGNGGADGAFVGLVLIGVLDIVALPVSGIITGIVVAASSDETKTARRVTHTRKHACPVPAVHAAIGLEVPTGEILTGETDERGVTKFELPSDAPLTGVVTARAEGVPAVTINY